MAAQDGGSALELGAKLDSVIRSQAALERTVSEILAELRSRLTELPKQVVDHMNMSPRSPAVQPMWSSQRGASMPVASRSASISHEVTTLDMEHKVPSTAGATCRLTREFSTPLRSALASSPTSRSTLSASASGRRLSLGAATDDMNKESGSNNSGEVLHTVWPEDLSYRLAQSTHRRRTQSKTLLRARSVHGHNDPYHDPYRERLSSEGVYVMCDGWKSFRSPTSPASVILKVCGACLLALDLVVTPYTLAWPSAAVDFSTALLRFSVCFWSLDLAMSFVWGFHRDGRLITDQWEISRRYLKSWFLSDLLLLSIDLSASITMALGGGSATSLRMLRIAKLGKIFRVLGILRALRYLRVLQEWADVFLNDVAHLCVKVSCILLMSAWFTHTLACLWYSVGMHAISDTGARWTNRFGDPSEHLYRQYVYSLQWSISVMTLGSIDVPCENSSERIFSSLGLVVGLIGSSMFVSILSAWMIESQMAAAERTLRWRRLRRYLSENRVRAGLVQAIQHQVAERTRRKHRLTEKDVKALQILSTSLLCELRFEIMGTPLTEHPLFRFFEAVDPMWVRRFLIDALDTSYLQPLDDLFLPSKEAAGAYHLNHGQLNYTQEPTKSRVMDYLTRKVDPGTWISEAAMWCDWLHVGLAQAQVLCDLLVVRPQVLADMIMCSSHIRAVAISYSRAYYKQVITAMPPRNPWPNDLQVPGTSWGELVLLMGQEYRSEICAEALEIVKKKAHRGSVFSGKKLLADLERELEEKRCILVVQIDGTVERVTSVISFEISRTIDARMLVQLGTWQDGQSHPCCRLPGGTRDLGEAVRKAADRMMDSTLGFLEGKLTFSNHEVDIDRREGTIFGVGVQSATVRVTVHATLHDVACIAAPVCELPRNSTGSRRPSGMTMSSWSSFLMMATPPRFTTALFIKSGEDAGTYYTWLSRDEIARYQTGSGEHHVACFLRELGPPPLDWTLASMSPVNSQESPPGDSLEESSVGYANAAPLTEVQCLR